jgi:hypothetical protein
MRASRTKNSLSSQALETFSDIIDELWAINYEL